MRLDADRHTALFPRSACAQAALKRSGEHRGPALLFCTSDGGRTVDVTFAYAGDVPAHCVFVADILDDTFMCQRGPPHL